MKEVKTLKTWTGKGFPRDFWNYSINPITGFSTRERQDMTEKDEAKYYTTAVSTLGVDV